MVTAEGMEAAQRRLEDYTRRVGEIQRRAEQTQEDLKNLRARASSRDGSVTVVLAPGGRLEKLDLSPRAMQLGHRELAATITQTIQAAHADAAGQTEAALRPLVGESQAMDFLRDQIGASLAEEDEQQPEAPRRPTNDDDDGSFGGPILRRER